MLSEAATFMGTEVLALRAMGQSEQKQAAVLSQGPHARVIHHGECIYDSPVTEGDIIPAPESLSMPGNTRPHGTGFVNM